MSTVSINELNQRKDYISHLFPFSWSYSTLKKKKQLPHWKKKTATTLKKKQKERESKTGHGLKL